MPDRSLRLFFALPCPPPLAERIGRWRDGRPLPGRQVATANLHLTLAFLGQVPSARLEALLDMAAAIEAAPFDLCLDRLLRWRNGILLLAPQPTARRPPAPAPRPALRPCRTGAACGNPPIQRPSDPGSRCRAAGGRPATPNLRMAGRPFQPVLLAKRRRGRALPHTRSLGVVRGRFKRAFRAVTTRLFRSATQVMTGRQEAADFLAWRKKAEAGTVPAQGTAKRFSRKDSGDGWQDAPLGPINLR